MSKFYEQKVLYDWTMVMTGISDGLAGKGLINSLEPYLEDLLKHSH